MNDKLLRSKMVLYGDTNAALAEYLEISPQRFSAKLNETGGAEFTQNEIKKIRNRYELSDAEVVNIFFA